MPGEIFPESYEGWLSPKTGRAPYKTIDDPAIIRRKNAIRESLREEYTKRMYNPYRRATGVGGFPFDPAVIRYGAMSRQCYKFFRPGPRLWWGWIVCVLMPYGIMVYAQERINKKSNEQVRTGQIAYKDREIKLFLC